MFGEYFCDDPGFDSLVVSHGIENCLDTIGSVGEGGEDDVGVVLDETVPLPLCTSTLAHPNVAVGVRSFFDGGADEGDVVGTIVVAEVANVATVLLDGAHEVGVEFVRLELLDERGRSCSQRGVEVVLYDVTEVSFLKG